MWMHLKPGIREIVWDQRRANFDILSAVYIEVCELKNVFSVPSENPCRQVIPSADFQELRDISLEKLFQDVCIYELDAQGPVSM